MQKKLQAVTAATIVGLYPTVSKAQSVFGPVPDIGGATDAREGTIDVVKAILSFMALIAVVMIIIAVFRAGASGSEEGADRLKKGILYVIVGLIVILLAAALVDFIIEVTSETRGS